ncbi:MAG: hypothetical protein ACLPYS_21205 [Vulcanimicrobiaceae bacterium]
MRSFLFVVLLIALGSQAALAASSTQGSTALALAALVGRNSPTLSWYSRSELARLLDGHATAPYPAHRQIVVHADSIVCRAGNVDITVHGCTLKFGTKTTSLSGRAAHELFATLLEVGVPGSGAAGTVYVGLTHLACTVDPHVIAQRGGGGATCTFVPGP